MSFSMKSKTFSEGKCPSTGCIQKKPNGKWGIISNKTGEFWKPDYESEESAKAALSAYHANKHFSDNKKYLAIVEYGYEDGPSGEEWDGDSSIYEFNSVEDAKNRLEKGKAAHAKMMKRGPAYQYYKSLGIFDSRPEAEKAISEFFKNLHNKNKSFSDNKFDHSKHKLLNSDSYKGKNYDVNMYKTEHGSYAIYAVNKKTKEESSEGWWYDYEFAAPYCKDIFKELESGKRMQNLPEDRKFSDIKSDEEFMTACHEAAKSILGDAYNKETTEETAKGILKDHKDEGFDAMMGIFVNGLRGDKNFSNRRQKNKNPKVSKKLSYPCYEVECNLEGSGNPNYIIHTVWSDRQDENLSATSSMPIEFISQTRKEAEDWVENSLIKRINNGEFDLFYPEAMANGFTDGEYPKADKAAKDRIKKSSKNFSDKTFSSSDEHQYYYTGLSSHKFTLDELEKLKSFIEKNENLVDLLMLWTGVDADSKVLVNDREWLQGSRKMHGLNESIRWKKTDDSFSEGIDNAKSDIADILKKIGIKFYKIECHQRTLSEVQTELKFEAYFKNQKNYDEALDIISKYEDANIINVGKNAINKIDTKNGIAFLNKYNLSIEGAIPLDKLKPATKTALTKKFSFIPLDKDPSVIKDKDDNSSKSTTTKVPEVTSLNIGKAFKMNVEPYLMAQAMNDPADGIYLGSLENEYITIDNDSKIILNIKTSTNGPLSVLAFIKNNRVYIWKCSQLVEGNKTFSNLAGFNIAIPEINLPTSEVPMRGYSFDLMPDEVKYDMDHLIGSWMLATSVCHLFHVCETDYAGHIALGDFYEGFPEKIDALAEHYLSDSDMAKFRVCIVPKSCPIDYLERLVAYTEDYAANVKFPSDYQSQIDDILNFTKSTLYKLKRLTSGRKIFK